LERGGELFVIPGDGGVGGQEEGVGQVVAAVEAGGLVLQDGGDEDDAVAGDAAVDEPAGKAGGAEGAVAFAGEVERRAPAVVLAEIEADEFADAGDVARHAPELLAEFGAGGAGVAGADGVDEDEVGEGEEGVGVIGDLVGRGRVGAVVAQGDVAGAEDTEVEPDGGRAGAAVEGDHERAAGRGGRIVEGVGDEEDVGFGFAGFVEEREAAGGGGVLQGPAAEGEGVLLLDRGRFGGRFGRLSAEHYGQQKRAEETHRASVSGCAGSG